MVVNLAPHLCLQLWRVDAAGVHQLLTLVCCCHWQWLRAGRLLPCCTALAAGVARPVLLAVLAALLLLVQLEGADNGQGVAVSWHLHVVVAWAAAAAVRCLQLVVALLRAPQGV